ncbi:MAG: hypothetical protein A2284_17820 [Deltaproteobacteria bacterium RIFOXYA12_FULL_61_11]|nr:MAG: hypothetical protein A2284_17820 [Deltaproteobacteria bacterium RIFOXYA12_FULL_61_11]
MKLRNYRVALALCGVSMLVGFAAEAQSIVGNGGDGVELEGKVYSLDLVEFGLQHHPYLSEDSSADPAVQMAVEAALPFARFGTKAILARKISQLLGCGFYVRFLPMLTAWQWILLEGVPLVDIKDEYSPVAAMHLVQIAVRDERFVRISSLGWERMDDANQAALVLHELYYILTASMYPEWATDSRNARALNAFVFSPAMATLNLAAVDEYFARFWIGHEQPEIEDMIPLRAGLKKTRASIEQGGCVSDAPPPKKAKRFWLF